MQILQAVPHNQMSRYNHLFLQVETLYDPGVCITPHV